MGRKTYQWLVDRQKDDDEPGKNIVEVVNNEGIELRLERMGFGQYASVSMTYIDTAEPFRFGSKDTSKAKSEHLISFHLALSGRATGHLPGLDEFVVDSQWGFLTDFPGGEGYFIVDPGQPLRGLGGTLSVGQVEALFTGDDFEAELEQLTRRRGVVKSILVTPAMRNIVANALATPLIGPLRRLYLEGTVLQLFALILQDELNDPVTGLLESTQAVAHKKTIETAGRLLLEDLSAPRGIIELSQATGLSQRKLRSGFKALYGCSMLDMLTRKRLQTARELLADQPDYPLKALAQDVGYNHQSNLITAFKREFGITPAAFAKTISR